MGARLPGGRQAADVAVPQFGPAPRVVRPGPLHPPRPPEDGRNVARPLWSPARYDRPAFEPCRRPHHPHLQPRGVRRGEAASGDSARGSRGRRSRGCRAVQCCTDRVMAITWTPEGISENAELPLLEDHGFELASLRWCVRFYQRLRPEILTELQSRVLPSYREAVRTGARRDQEIFREELSSWIQDFGLP